MAIRSIWNGTVQFGLVGIPVGATSALTEQTVKFSQGIVAEDGIHAVGRKEYDKVTDEIVTRSQISKIYTFADGRQVVVADEEVASVAEESSKVMEVTATIPKSQIPLTLATKHEFLFPREGGEQAYDLFVTAMQDSETAAVSTTVRRGKSHVVVLHAENGVLVATYMAYASEVKKVEVEPVEKTAQTKAMAAMVTQVLDSLSDKVDWTTFKDAAKEELLALIEAKADGTDLPVAERVEQSSTASLLDALAASIKKEA